MDVAVVMAMLFENRTEAGSALASKLTKYRNQPDVRVLALPRGGVPVALEVARALHAPMDVFIVRKLGLPGHPELAMGAIATGGVRVLNPSLVKALEIPEATIEAVAVQEQKELERRERAYRGDRLALDILGRTVILVDDGLATGATMQAAVQAARTRQAARVVVAVPVGAPEACEELRAKADETVCVHTPAPFQALGQWYADFSQTTDDDVQALLDCSRHIAVGPS
jgi:putative phosphoribosyl transferase